MASTKFWLLLLLVFGLCLTESMVDGGRRGGGGRRMKQFKQQQSMSTNEPYLSTSEHDHRYFQPPPPPPQHSSSSSSSVFQFDPSPEDEEYFEELKPTGHKCEDIRIEICRDVGYNVTSMPNFVGHELQSDAELQLQSFLPLISYGCSSQLKFFLCSVYVPMCTEKVPVMIGPCRPLCETVKNRCAPVLMELGFSWPSVLNCSKFVPENTIDHMCMEGPQPHESELIPIPSTILNNHNNINNNHLNGSGFSPDTRMRFYPEITNVREMPPLQHHSTIFLDHNNHPSLEVSTSKNDMILKQPALPSSTSSSLPAPPPPPSIFIKSSQQCAEYRRAEYYVYLEHPRGRCVPRCETDVMFNEDNKNFVDYWTLIWAIISLSSCLFTLVAFIWSPQWFRYPERAISYIALCYSVYALAYVYRAMVGRKDASCYQEGPNTHLWLLVQEGAHNPHCTITFIMLYYFGMAGNAWWLVLTICWSLSNWYGWSIQRLSYHSQLYHSLAWTVPALQTLAALVMRAVDADELTGICFVGNQNDGNLLKFVIIPMVFYLGTGIGFILFSFFHNCYQAYRSRFQACRCCCNNSNNIEVSSSSTTTTTFTNIEEDNSCSNGSNMEQEMDHTSSCYHESSPVVGCGDFCRRIRKNFNNGKHGCPHHHHHHRHDGPGLGVASQAGSGHSLLLPNNCQARNFCSTVSSTSSYSSTITSTGTTTNTNHNLHQNNIINNKNNNSNNVALGTVESNLFNRPSIMASINNNQINANNDGNHPLNMSNVARNGNNLRTYPGSYHHHNHLRPNHGNNNNNNNNSSGHNNDRTSPKDPALVRSGIFAIFYTLPALCVLCTYIFEYIFREQWLLRNTNADNQDPLQAGSSTTAISLSRDHPFQQKLPMESIDMIGTNFELFNVRLFMSLVIGIKTGVWILTAKSPITFLRCLFRRCMTKKVFGPNQTSQLHHHHHHLHHHHSIGNVPLNPRTNGTATVLNNMVQHKPMTLISNDQHSVNSGGHQLNPRICMQYANTANKNDNFFFMDDKTTAGIMPHPPSQPQPQIQTTVLHGNHETMFKCLNGPLLPKQQPIATNPGNKLMLDNPVHNFQPQPQQLPIGFRYAPQQNRAAGNETAV